MYFQAIMLINIKPDYSALILAIQKDWKDKNTNLVEEILQIIRYFKFIERNKKTYNIIQTFNSNLLIHHIPKSFYINVAYIEKMLATHYINYY